MKHLAFRLVVSLFTFAVGIASFALLHPGRHHAVANSQDEQAVLQMEHEYIEAHLNGDTETLDNILADDFTLRTRWRTVTKAQRLSQLSDPNFAFDAINTDGVEVEVDGDQAVVTGEAYTRVSYGDERFTSPVYSFARSYERHDGRWQIISVRTECR
jgi:hypothetical protein